MERVTVSEISSTFRNELVKLIEERKDVVAALPQGLVLSGLADPMQGKLVFAAIAVDARERLEARDTFWSRLKKADPTARLWHDVEDLSCVVFDTSLSPEELRALR